MDNLVFEESVNTEVEQSEFIEKKWVYVNDNNSQNYSSQVVIDSTPLANAGGYVNWSEGYILMPLVAHLTGVADAVGVASYTKAGIANSVAMKNGYWQMLNSMSIEFNNQTIVQQTPFLNVFRSFKAHTTLSQDDLVNHGNDIGYAFDSADSWEWNDVGGVNNSKSVPPHTDVGAGFWDVSKINEGLKQRFDNVSVCSDSVRGKSNVITNATRSAQYQTHLNSFSTVAGTANVIASVDAVWHIYAKLRLKDLSEYFEKCPMLKGSTMRFLINTNQVQVDFKLSATGVVSQTSADLTVSVLGGNTCPVQLGFDVVADELGVGGKVPTSVAGTYRLTLDIAKSRQDGSKGSALSSVRLYAPVYRFNPMAEQRYLSLSPTKKIEYNDIFQYQFNGIGAEHLLTF